MGWGMQLRNSSCDSLELNYFCCASCFEALPDCLKVREMRKLQEKVYMGGLDSELNRRLALS